MLVAEEDLLLGLDVAISMYANRPLQASHRRQRHPRLYVQFVQQPFNKLGKWRTRCIIEISSRCVRL